MLNKLNEIELASLAEIASASSTTELDSLKVKYLGKKGALTSILRGLGALTPEERPVIGAAANVVRQKIEENIDARSAELSALQLKAKLKNDAVDISLPGKKKELGHPSSAFY